MNIDQLITLEPQCAEVEYGKEPSLLSLIEKYYEPYFPENYKTLAVEYVEQLKSLIKDEFKGEGIIVGSEVEVVMDNEQSGPDSFINDGINIGDRGVVIGVDNGKFPINVRFLSGIIIGFWPNELEVIGNVNV